MIAWNAVAGVALCSRLWCTGDVVHKTDVPLPSCNSIGYPGMLMQPSKTVREPCDIWHDRRTCNDRRGACERPFHGLLLTLPASRMQHLHPQPTGGGSALTAKLPSWNIPSCECPCMSLHPCAPSQECGMPTQLPARWCMDVHCILPQGAACATWWDISLHQQNAVVCPAQATVCCSSHFQPFVGTLSPQSRSPTKYIEVLGCGWG